MGEISIFEDNKIKAYDYGTGYVLEVVDEGNKWYKVQFEDGAVRIIKRSKIEYVLKDDIFYKVN